jgi:acyl-CoA hydrolase
MFNLKILSAEEAVQEIPKQGRVFVQGSAATPIPILNAMAKHAALFNNLELVSISLLGDIKINNPELKSHFFFNSLFVSKPIRNNVNSLNGDYIPVFLSEIHLLFEKNILPLDAAIVQVSPPDLHGFCSLGTSVDVAKAAVNHAKKTIALINPAMPRTHGDGMIHLRDIHTLVESNQALPEIDYRTQITPIERKLADLTANLIPNGATLQMGIGVIPDAVLQSLNNHQNLGVHTEMFSNGIIDLMKKGIINNRLKAKHRFKTVAAFAIGNRELYDFIHDNPEFAFLNAAYVNDPNVIAKNPNVVAINSAIEIDLTGQVCADSIGFTQYSGVGGQMDFIRGAAQSKGGVPIIVLPSQTKSGKSKIVPTLSAGAGVVTTRAHVHHIITENGSTNLFGKSLRQRAESIVNLAHENHKEELNKAVFQRFGPKYF